MSKYNYFEMCKKIFGNRYKWDKHKHEYTLFTRSDMWDKLVEQQQEIEKLNAYVDFYKSYYISFHEKLIYELEKVKEKAMDLNGFDMIQLKKYIDNQINQLEANKLKVR